MPSPRIVPGAKAGRERVLVDAVEVARDALRDLTRPENVGVHVGFVVEGDRLLTHAFECLLEGYRNWFWTVTVSRVPRSTKVTINEMALCPGPDALLAPDWIPWADRIEPSDVSPVDRLPYKAEDPRLTQGFQEVGEDADEVQAFELGLGRARVLSDEGRSAAFERWYRGEGGPNTEGTRAARATCSTCGFLMRMGGTARRLFGVCANEWSAYDGRVVSFDHGCGSHSETDVANRPKVWDASDPILDEHDMEVVKGTQV
ncbi:MAG: DUF3027 domain-containing protein [Actinomycetaceae bacterium]|nr:DUF3027 domain-containing protein [Actinomycetaceae bacterium]